ncbi:MAG: hypothetical protein BGP10_10855 [Rhodanobacter sp. 68-29]|uniref:hypothetical protein n=1 Tax=Rhodanobacter sp. PCA2 TaxID=2006117 RepID=UPI00086BC861|nr:hypothetical protein [Rhodanobacter sp. PCA2]MBA2079120.1 hypothetical protein [Rhodanobacter sp. PCA2]MBN8922662.1 hypothetical protein [Rhodanobacter sp.]ODU76043.1 MAG: hypothetical protein ABT17_01115 [Rhodanobacter sp. SCN 69-32]OJY62258.1 MAG: hypothetical protein BGP10_10855 [Rhodanobacter sp. 68-29]
MKRLVIALTASLLATAALAQTSGQPLNLKLPPQSDLPPSDLPAHAGTTSKPASSAPGVYYGDTSGRTRAQDEQLASAQRCDDSTYNQAQMHGSVGMGVMAGNHMSGNYQTGTVGVTKRLGDCDHPTGAVSFSIGVGKSNFHGRGW